MRWSYVGFHSAEPSQVLLAETEHASGAWGRQEETWVEPCKPGESCKGIKEESHPTCAWRCSRVERV